ncbi:hypothetical protein K438DRAFT_1997347 [Mycena galopus ATCC 62051]|nr:hypothetical protein K438DRAFT_1997347 [Mycena galopus ATCC 62051]
MSLPALDPVTGCLLVGTWASSVLYAFEITQSRYYFCHFEQDDWKLKTLVTAALVIDTLSFVGDYVNVYLGYMTLKDTITHAGDLEYLTNVHWPTPLYGFTTGVLALLVQGFLVVRYWKFTRNALIALSMSLAIIISFGSVFTCSLMLTLYTSFADRQKFEIPAVLWLVTEVVVDTSIALALLWEFKKAKEILLGETKRVMDRLMAVTIQSGALAATLATAALISYYIMPESNVYTGFLYPLGRVYVITLLSNLNIRKPEQSSVYTARLGSGPRSPRDAQGPPTFTKATNDSSGIHVDRTVHTSVQVNLESPQDRFPMTFKNPLTGSSSEEIEMAVDYSSKKQSSFSA